MAHNFSVENLKASPKNGIFSMSPVPLTYKSPMAWSRTSQEPARKWMVQIVYLAFFNLTINVLRDQGLGTPLKRLMSRRIRCFLPVAEKPLASRTLKNKHVSSPLKLKRMQQKAWYDRIAKFLSSLNLKRVARLQSDKGYEKVGIVK